MCFCHLKPVITHASVKIEKRLTEIKYTCYVNEYKYCNLETAFRIQSIMEKKSWNVISILDNHENSLAVL